MQRTLRLFTSQLPTERKRGNNKKTKYKTQKMFPYKIIKHNETTEQQNCTKTVRQHISKN